MKWRSHNSSTPILAYAHLENSTANLLSLKFTLTVLTESNQKDYGSQAVTSNEVTMTVVLMVQAQNKALKILCCLCLRSNF